MPNMLGALRLLVIPAALPEIVLIPSSSSARYVFNDGEGKGETGLLSEGTGTFFNQSLTGESLPSPLPTAAAGPERISYIFTSSPADLEVGIIVGSGGCTVDFGSVVCAPVRTPILLPKDLARSRTS